MSKCPKNSETENSSTSPIDRLAFELIGAILDYLDVTTFQKTIRTAKFLRYPSEQRLYHQVAFRAFSNSWDTQACFLETIAQNDRLAQHVVRLVLERGSPVQTAGDARIHRSIGQGMKKLVNLKQLNIHGSSVIISAHLESVPFRLTHLVMSGEKTNYTDPDPPLLSILQAHPTLEELALRFSPLPCDLVSTLKAEREGLTSESGILCPKLKRFDGYDEGMRLLLPMRKIESRTTLGPGVEYINDDGLVDVWLTPVLIESYKHLRILEVWPNRPEGNRRHFLSIIAPYLTSLTHLHLLDDLRLLHPTDCILLSLGEIPTLESVTFSESNRKWNKASQNAREVLQLVCTVCPDIQEIFVQDDETEGELDPTDEMYFRYTKGGVHDSFVDYRVACKPYADWLHDY